MADTSIAVIGECMIEIARPPGAGGPGPCALGYAGDTLNASVYMARLGLRPAYITAIGTDPYSKEMLAFWKREGIATELVARRPEMLPGLYMISTDSEGERRFHYWRNDSAARSLFSESGDDDILVVLPRFRMIYWSGISLAILKPAARGRLFKALTKARAGGSQIVFDANYRARLWPDTATAREAYSLALGCADLVFTGAEDETPVFADADEAQLLDRHRAAGVKETVIKGGARGCRLVVPAQGLDVEVAAAPVADVVDTTAAGDSFAAAYLAARSRGAAPDDAARAGHRLAAAVVGVRGAILPLERMPPP